MKRALNLLGICGGNPSAAREGVPALSAFPDSRRDAVHGFGLAARALGWRLFYRLDFREAPTDG